jgi:hypothetical protein
MAFSLSDLFTIALLGLFDTQKVAMDAVFSSCEWYNLCWMNYIMYYGGHECRSGMQTMCVKTWRQSISEALRRQRGYLHVEDCELEQGVSRVFPCLNTMLRITGELNTSLASLRYGIYISNLRQFELKLYTYIFTKWIRVKLFNRRKK